MVDLSRLCLRCFRDKGQYEVCPHCGYAAGMDAGQSYYLQPGTILAGRYIIGTVIGFGGFGITYKAFDAKLDMIIAIKEFYPNGMVNRQIGNTYVEIFTNSQSDDYHHMMERFLEEARNMAMFSKEQDIVTVYDFFEENYTAYIVMEYIEGMLLRDYLKEYGCFSVEDAVPLFLDILNAVKKLHEHGIIHKDISPDNIFILEQNKIKLFDFGAANFQGKQDEEFHEVVIKAGYAPPEQYSKDTIPKPTLDIYAAGALLYHMVTGIIPLEATDRRIRDELMLPSETGVAIDMNLERTILKAMALEPKQRFQSVSEFYDTLKESRTVEIINTTQKKNRYAIVQRAMLGALMAAAAAAGAFIIHYRMDIRNYVPKENTKLNVWIAEDASVNEEEAQEITDNLRTGFEERYPETKVEISMISKEEYASKLQTVTQDEMPDVYCADYLGKDRMSECADLSKIVKNLDSVMYLFEDEYGEIYPAKNQIPIGFEMAVYYRNTTKQELPQAEESVELEEINRLTENGECQWLPQKEGVGKICKNMLKTKSPVNGLVGSLVCWTDVQNVTVSNKSKALQIIPVVEESSLLCAFCDSYAVKKNQDKNQEKTAMLFLYYLLGNTAQRELGLKQNAFLPVNAKTYREYMNNLRQYKTDYIEENIKVTDSVKISVSDQVKLDSSSAGLYEVYGGE